MSNSTHLPKIIQGGMGVAVSNWRLARTVSRLGELGVISGTLLAVVLARRLADGDQDGQMRHALAHFPVPGVAERVLDKHFVEGGTGPDAPYLAPHMPTLSSPDELTELTVAATFAEVFLAKEGHTGQIGMNLLEKLQTSTLPSLFGAILAGVDWILMGAGIPRSIPGALDKLAAGEVAELRVDVEGAAPGEEHVSRFDPKAFCREWLPKLKRPNFLAIVSSATLGLTLAKKSNGQVNGFVIEGEPAGGHNAPPRGPMQLSSEGEPVYGARDVPDLQKFRDLGLPFWLAGSQAEASQLDAALKAGAAGVQIGTAFAFCRESGITDELKKAAIEGSRNGTARVFTDPLASPTGFPFKVMTMPGTMSEKSDYAARPRICDLGYLRQPYRKEDGSLGYRCAAEPVANFVRKGGAESETVGRKCLCNGLIAAVGLGQRRAAGNEVPILTAGRDVSKLWSFVPPGQDSYSAEDVIRRVRGEVAAV